MSVLIIFVSGMKCGGDSPNLPVGLWIVCSCAFLPKVMKIVLCRPALHLKLVCAGEGKSASSPKVTPKFKDTHATFTDKPFVTLVDLAWHSLLLVSSQK